MYPGSAKYLRLLENIDTVEVKDGVVPIFHLVLFDEFGNRVGSKNDIPQKVIMNKGQYISCSKSGFKLSSNGEVSVHGLEVTLTDEISSTERRDFFQTFSLVDVSSNTVYCSSDIPFRMIPQNLPSLIKV